MISNSKNQPAIGPAVTGNTFPQSWSSGSDNYAIFTPDEYVTTGSGVFDLTKIIRMEIGYLFDFGNYRQTNPTDLTDYVFGAFVETPAVRN